jgi:hypothetical protein
MEMAIMMQHQAATMQAASTYTLGKAMNFEAQSAATLIADMQAATPAPALATPAGHMDIRV